MVYNRVGKAEVEEHFSCNGWFPEQKVEWISCVLLVLRPCSSALSHKLFT